MNHQPSLPSPTRRRFLQQSAAAATFGFPAILHSASPNSKVQVAAIGVGGFGYRTFTEVASHPKVAVTALCDVNAAAITRAAKDFPDAAKHRDWRSLLADAGDTFDALVVATPDHMHAAPGVTALRARKHLYVQKPLAPTLHECRVLAEEAAKAGTVTQLGNQRRSSVESRATVELLRAGAIGKVKEVIIWENKPLSWWPKNTLLRPTADPVPEGFDWDLWLGVREARPYLDGTYHPMSWRAWLDFGVGELGDMGCHHFDESLDGLALGAPQRVRQTTPGSDGPLWSERREVELIFPGTEFTAGDTLQITWYDGDLRPDASRIPLPEDVSELPESGTCWIGENGTLFKNFRGGKPIVLPEASFSPQNYPSDLPPRSHYHEWIDAILSDGETSSDFRHGGQLSETVLVGALADRFAGEWLEWDSQALAFTNHPAATALVRRDYRDGWKVPGLG